MEHIDERYAKNNGVILHFLDANKGSDNRLTPLVHIPGAFGAAETFMEDMKHFFPRRCVSVSLRGRGKSSVPKQGYRLNDLVSDFEVIIKETGLTEFYLYAFSFAVPTAIRFTLNHQTLVRGLIIGDYPARYPQLPLSWTEKFLPHPELVSSEAVLATQKESVEEPLWDELINIHCPVLILTGGNKLAQPQPVLTNNEIERYKKNIKDCSVFVFEDTGHRLWEPNHDKYAATINEFMGNGTKRTLSGRRVPGAEFCSIIP